MTRDAGNDNTAAALRERMAQTALLPQHDPLRVAVEKEVVALGVQSPAGREWADIVEEADQLKHALATVSVPEHMEETLLELTLPPVLPWWRRSIGQVATPLHIAIAAGLLLVIAAGWWGYGRLAEAREARAIQHVATLAADLHADLLKEAPKEQIETSDAELAQKWLRARVPFAAQVFSGTAAKLQGAGIVHLGGATAALTLWQEGAWHYSLLEFAPGDLGLPLNFPAYPGPIASASAPASPAYRVLMWSDPSYRCGWALAMDPKAPLPFTVPGCPQ